MKVLCDLLYSVLNCTEMLTVLDSVEFPAVGSDLDPSLAHVDTARARCNSGIPLSTNLFHLFSVTTPPPPLLPVRIVPDIVLYYLH
jgi:hypothetical protein